MVYQYKWQRELPYGNVPADVAGHHIEKLMEKEGIVTTQNLLDSARPEDSPIHPCYEWDDSIAAERYRRKQSRDILNNLVRVEVVETVTEPLNTVKAFVNIADNDKFESGKYVYTNVAFANDGMKDIILRKALDELNSFKKRYENLKELADVFSAIDETEKRMGFQ